MTARPRRFRTSVVALIGAGACGAALLAVLADPTMALRGWLAAAFFWSALPIGAFCLLMMMRLIPGRWSEELTPSAEAAVLLLPLGALAFLPVLCGVHPLFEWTGEALEGAFRSAYLTPWFFILRSAIFFAAAMAIAALLLLRPAWSTPVSCAGLVFFAMAGTAMSVDWLMSLEPHFHSSGFGLYALILQVDTALALLVIATLAVRPKLERPGVLGGLMLTALLLWAYFAFMQYFVIWSGDLPPGVRWYQNRSGGVWGPLFQFLGLLRLAAAGLLLFGPMRKHRGWLIGIAAATLLAGALEAAWLVLPAGGTPVGWVGAVAWLLALVGLGALTLAALMGAHRGLARRSPGRTSAGEAAA